MIHHIQDLPGQCPEKRGRWRLRSVPSIAAQGRSEIDANSSRVAGIRTHVGANQPERESRGVRGSGMRCVTSKGAPLFARLADVKGCSSRRQSRPFLTILHCACGEWDEEPVTRDRSDAMRAIPPSAVLCQTLSKLGRPASITRVGPDCCCDFHEPRAKLVESDTGIHTRSMRCTSPPVMMWEERTQDARFDVKKGRPCKVRRCPETDSAFAPSHGGPF